MVKNIEACDEVWAVNRGAGENLKSLGYTGDYYVMKNGVDYDNVPSPDEDIKALNDEYGLPSDGTPVFLFVGRMFWYKGAKIILDSLREIRTMNKDFRMIFVGKGGDAEDMKKYAEELGIGDKCIFAGAVYDRKKLKAFYTRADLLFLPSTFDNDPLVVKEAASAHTASVLIRDSSSADDVVHMENGILIEENYGSLTGALLKMYASPERMRELGENASRDLYLSWDDSVARAMRRYDEVLRRCPKGSREHPKARYDKLIEFIADAYKIAEKMREKNGKAD
jgi:glycosyltransferase involved in cell wall biosynthesis